MTQRLAVYILIGAGAIFFIYLLVTSKMASKSYRVSESDGKFRVVLGGKPQPSIDSGGYKSKQDALDAAMKANRKRDRGLGSGMADKAADQVSNRGNRIERALNKATGN